MVHILISLVYTKELPTFAVDALDHRVNKGDTKPERLLAWLAEQVSEDPNWAFHASLVEEKEDDALEDEE